MNSLYTFEESYLVKKKKEMVDSTLAPAVSTLLSVLLLFSIPHFSFFG